MVVMENNQENQVNNISKESENSNIEIIGEYINNNTKIECKCLICENIFFMTPKNFI